MIFRAITVPTPKRIRKYFEKSYLEINREITKHSDSIERKNSNIESRDDSLKNLGFSVKIF